MKSRIKSELKEQIEEQELKLSEIKKRFDNYKITCLTDLTNKSYLLDEWEKELNLYNELSHQYYFTFGFEK